MLELMKKLVWTLLFLSGIALAGDFESRVKAGRQALGTVAGQSYEASWGAIMKTILPACIPVGSESPANLGKFTFVADVAPSGLVSAVAVEPTTAVSLCFARRFNGAQLPQPPASPSGGSLFPVSDEIEVRP
jgi:hypothetical protein